MANQKLTKRFIDGLKPPDSGRYITWDTEIPAFGITTYPKSKVFVLMYRSNGRLRKFSIGKFGVITLDQARKRAKEILADAAKGKDPASQRDMFRRGITVAELATQYIERYAKPRKRTWSEDERYLQKDVIPYIGKRRAASIQRKDIIALLDRLVNRDSPIAANRLLACLHKMFSWAARRDLIPLNPAGEIDRPSDIKKRQRSLSDSELTIVLSNLSQAALSPITQLAIRMLILTGQRSGEVLNMEWNEVDLETKLWSIPDDKTKNKKPHEVPLSPQAMKVIDQAKEFSGGRYVFSDKADRPLAPTALMKGIRRSEAPTETRGPVFGLSEPWVVHDLRRSVVTGMGDLGIDDHIIERVVNHALTGLSQVAGTYNVGKYRKQKKDALDRWGKHVARLEVSDRLVLVQ